MIQVDELVRAIEQIANPSGQMANDNCGLLISPAAVDISKVLISLELTSSVAEEAAEEGYDFLIVHHPIFFMGAKRLMYDDPANPSVLKFARNTKAGLYAAHTSYDGAEEGLSESLAEALNIEISKEVLEVSADIPGKQNLDFCRKGRFKTAMTLRQAVEHVKSKLGNEDVYKYCGDEEALVENVLVCCGGGADTVAVAAALDCSLFITGDARHHEWRIAEELGLALIDAGHYNTEKQFALRIKRQLENLLVKNGTLNEKEAAQLFHVSSRIASPFKILT